MKLKQYLIVVALMVSLLAAAGPQALVGGSQERTVEPIVPGLLHAEYLHARIYFESRGLCLESRESTASWLLHA